MDSKISELTNKIYSEGIEKSKKEGAEIVEKARIESDGIMRNAKIEAERIIQNAQKEAAEFKSRANQELKMAAAQSVSLLKQEITNVIFDKVFSETLKKSLNETDFIKNLIKDIVSRWDSNSGSLDLNIILPENKKEEFVDFFKSKSNSVLKEGIEVFFESRMTNGFKIGPKDKTFILSFTDKDFYQFFYSFLKPQIKDALFGGE
ncbi:MAG TPA: HrpE/YscL family type III secretion apparatus protein [Spirochaetota bacterium]|jgi:V/A-type H+-transporting ATPase subunit E|nr:MAG: V-type ATP synthase subunit E [Spirochaetes bacterium ADurb.Bin133]HOF01594.1 HrpE/YscL family type III secretion apparatus protein [Spirochaetota bacterium]HOS32913.1 HrpE/YscL family type III secretion apparatus protein [Spirochaetota bacterium]HOS56099.1 HrpE/YscL family type III secretion apparatus protein [Spirochaetota bacterium]HPK61944.1 HrpE/YscL family type III secretion apparatus protein [Spirochaetota bacterium]